MKLYFAHRPYHITLKGEESSEMKDAEEPAAAEQHELEAVLVKALAVAGMDRKFGAGPPGQLERVCQQMLDKHWERDEGA